MAKTDEKEKIDGYEVVLSVALYHPVKVSYIFRNFVCIIVNFSLSIHLTCYAVKLKQSFISFDS